ncbi:MAG: hypothetical protein H6Q68_2209 [Firmicutes bacterium]|nr:hypothetical protein [Bacillota bacterium]
MALPKPWGESSNLFTRSSKFKPSQVISKAFLIVRKAINYFLVVRHKNLANLPSLIGSSQESSQMFPAPEPIYRQELGLFGVSGESYFDHETFKG